MMILGFLMRVVSARLEGDSGLNFVHFRNRVLRKNKEIVIGFKLKKNLYFYNFV